MKFRHTSLFTNIASFKIQKGTWQILRTCILTFPAVVPTNRGHSIQLTTSMSNEYIMELLCIFKVTQTTFAYNQQHYTTATFLLNLLTIDIVTCGYWYKHSNKQNNYKPCWMRIISPGRWSGPTWSGFLKSSVVVCCRVGRDKMVASHARQWVSGVFPTSLPRLTRKAANFVKFRLRNSLISFLVLSEYLGRLGAKAKIVWISRIRQDMSHCPLGNKMLP